MDRPVPKSFAQRAAEEKAPPVTQSFKQRRVHTSSVREVELERNKAFNEEIEQDKAAHPVQPFPSRRCRWPFCNDARQPHLSQSGAAVLTVCGLFSACAV